MVQTFIIGGITCSSCTGAIQNHFLRSGPNGTPFPGIIDVNINLLTKKGVFKFYPEKIKQREIISEIEDLGFEAHVKPDDG